MKRKDQLSRYVMEQVLLRGRVTRTEIAEATGIRLATVGEAVRELVVAGLLEEPERAAGGSTGRRASPLQINPGHGSYLGIALSPGCLQAVLLDAAGEPTMPPLTFPLDRPNPEGVFRKIKSMLGAMRREAGPSWERIRAAGFADPGLVDEPNGVSMKAVNLPGWEMIETRKKLETITGCPVLIRPEMSARAHAERRDEGLIEDSGWFHLNLGTGVGGAFTRGMDVFTGDTFCQMEIGHIVVDENGALCQCGNHGCLEAVIGHKGLARRIEQLRQTSVDTTLTRDAFSLPWLVECARNGDKAAARLVVEAAQQTGKALAAAVTLLNPAGIILSGALFSLRDMVLPVLRQSLALHCLPQAVARIEWRITSADDYATARGAALLARHQSLLGRTNAPDPGNAMPE